MEYAIVQISGKQFFIRSDRWSNFDLVKKIGANSLIALNKILLVKNTNKIQLGKPFIKGSILLAKVSDKIKGPKLIILKTKPKKNYTRTRGHRQKYSQVKLIA